MEGFKLSKPRLIIDPGHGGKDPGGGSNEHWQEKKMALDISLYQYRRFRKLNVPVAITRTQDVYLSPEERTRIVRESGAVDCISNHLNAAQSPSARGVETIHSIHSNGELARQSFGAIVAEGMPGRRVFTRAGSNGRDYYFMHRQTGAVETVIVEYGFATNPDDTKWLLARWRVFAEAVVRVYCKYAGFDYSPPSAGTERKGKSLPSIHGEASVVIHDEKPVTGYLIDNRVYVPLRLIGEKLGGKVSWNNRHENGLHRTDGCLNGSCNHFVMKL